jgi:hypothetical protein
MSEWAIDGCPLRPRSVLIPIGARALRGQDCYSTPDPKVAVMPNGILPVPEFHPTPSRGTPPVGVRVWTRLRRDHLDRELARGADPAASAAFALREAQLRSRDERARLANAFEETLGDARRGEPVTIRIRPQRAEVRACADELRDLVGRLRDDNPVDIRGAAITARLVRDRRSPLRHPGGVDLRSALQAAHTALDTPAQRERELATAA